MREILKYADVRRFIVVSLLLFWCVSMIAVRVDRTGSGYYVFLIANLFLACVPLGLSTMLRVASHWRVHWIIQLLIFSLWLLFLPNAPYILTDILHLTRTSDAPAWYDLALLLSCAGTGLLVGYLSLFDVQGIVGRGFGAACGWMFALVSLVLSGFAIYLGRFLRWNSWDVLVHPSLLFQLMRGILHPWSHAESLVVTFIFGVILTLGYITFRTLITGSHRTTSVVDETISFHPSSDTRRLPS